MIFGNIAPAAFSFTRVVSPEGHTGKDEGVGQGADTNNNFVVFGGYQRRDEALAQYAIAHSAACEYHLWPVAVAVAEATDQG